MERKEKEEHEKKIETFIAGLLLIEIISIIALTSLFIVHAEAIGHNVTVITRLSIGNSAPEITNITINEGTGSIDLIQNSTKTVIVQAIVRDYNGEGDISHVNMEFFDNTASFYGDSNDNNKHYTNNSCTLDPSYGDSIEINATCMFNLWYYANNATWNATVFVNDTNSLSVTDNKQAVINSLLAIGLPDSIDYGLVNATNVSNEQIANITNFGNVRINLSLQGYAYNISDGWAMNCTLGTTQNISVYYEKFNLTSSNTSVLSLTQLESHYGNLTSSTVVKTFNLNFRQNDTNNEATNSTYWRIYVPKGVAGSCSGNIVFGATKANGN